MRAKKYLQSDLGVGDCSSPISPLVRDGYVGHHTDHSGIKHAKEHGCIGEAEKPNEK